MARAPSHIRPTAYTPRHASEYAPANTCLRQISSLSLAPASFKMATNCTIVSRDFFINLLGMPADHGPPTLFNGSAQGEKTNDNNMAIGLELRNDEEVYEPIE
jgi:hypothetical protein